MKKAPRDILYVIFSPKTQDDHLQAFKESTLHRGGMLAKFRLMVNLIAQLCEGRMWGPWWCFICHLRSGCLSPGTNVTPVAGETGPGSWHSGKRGLARSRRSSLTRRQMTRLIVKSAHSLAAWSPRGLSNAWVSDGWVDIEEKAGEKEIPNAQPRASCLICTWWVLSMCMYVCEVCGEMDVGQRTESRAHETQGVWSYSTTESLLGHSPLTSLASEHREKSERATGHLRFIEL